MTVDLEPWHDLFVMSGGAAAALAGLLFVAVSLNLDTVLQYARLPALAAESTALLISLVVIALLGLAPGQPTVAFGAELLVIGLLLVVVVVVPTLRSLPALERALWKLRVIAMAAGSTVPLLVAGVLLAAGSAAGLGWLVAQEVGAFTVAALNAWILLIEIRR